MTALIGELRHRVTLQVLSLASDSGGGGTISWQPLSEVWASVEPLSARPDVQGERTVRPVTYRIIVRYLAVLMAARRIIFKDKRLSVISLVNIDESDRFIEFTAVEDLPT